MYEIHHSDGCNIKVLAVKELAQGNWSKLNSLTIGKYIVMKLSKLEMRDVNSSSKYKLIRCNQSV